MALHIRSWRNWRGRRLVALLAVLAAILFAAVQLFEKHEVRRQLLTADPDAIPLNPRLVRDARTLAEPAYATTCAACHGAQLEGNSSIGAPNLKDRDWLYDEGRVVQIEQLILYGIRAGHGKTRALATMPAYGTPVPSKTYAVPPLAPQQIRDVVQYLLQLGGASHDPVAAQRGRGFYRVQGACYDCHSNDGQGDGAVGAPNLVDKVWLYGRGTPDDIYRSIAGGRQGVCPPWITRLSLLTIRALAVFIYDESHPIAAADKSKS